jgi:hypothetical protein
MTYTRTHYLQSKKFNFLQKNFVLKFYCILQALFLSAQHLFEKRKGSGSGHADPADPDPQQWFWVRVRMVLN